MGHWKKIGLNEGCVQWVLQPSTTELTFGFLKKLHYVIHRRDGWTPGPKRVEGKTPTGFDRAWIYPHTLNSEQIFLASDERGTSVLSTITVSIFGSTFMSIAVRCQHTSRNRSVDATGSLGKPCALGLGDSALTGWDCLSLSRCCVWETLSGFSSVVFHFLENFNWGPSITEIHNNHHFDLTAALSQISFRKLGRWETGCVPWSKLY